MLWCCHSCSETVSNAVMLPGILYAVMFLVMLWFYQSCGGAVNRVVMLSVML
jgi:hypothetical protein